MFCLETCCWASTVSHVIALITIPPLRPQSSCSLHFTAQLSLTRLLHAAGVQILFDIFGFSFIHTSLLVYLILHCINYLVQTKICTFLKHHIDETFDCVCLNCAIIHVLRERPSRLLSLALCFLFTAAFIAH